VTYAVKEIFYSIQGEGVNAGCPALFLRFAGCNLWSGREEDRDKATCRFCDTDFLGTNGTGGGKCESAGRVADVLDGLWPRTDPRREERLVVCTGGEPLLQLDDVLVSELHARGFRVALETNGTIAAPRGIDWICVSPKTPVGDLEQRSGDELKLVYPQEGFDPSDFEDLGFQHFIIQPKDGPDKELNTRLSLAYCLQHPRWRLGLQVHKVLGVR